MANIVSMKSVNEIEGAHVTMDTKHDWDVSVTLKDGVILRFERHTNSMYYIDLDK